MQKDTSVQFAYTYGFSNNESLSKSHPAHPDNLVQQIQSILQDGFCYLPPGVTIRWEDLLQDYGEQGSDLLVEQVLQPSIFALEAAIEREEEELKKIGSRKEWAQTGVCCVGALAEVGAVVAVAAHAPTCTGPAAKAAEAFHNSLVAPAGRKLAELLYNKKERLSSNLKRQEMAFLDVKKKTVDKLKGWSKETFKKYMEECRDLVVDK
jgi:hypothetical protein